MNKFKRMILLDVLMAGWGLSTWLGVNGMYVQLPLLVQELPEGWALPSSMTVAIAAANVGLFLYAALRRLLPRVSDSHHILGLLVMITLALFINSFVYSKTAVIGTTERSVAFLTITFFVALVGCTSSVLFYPYLRHFRDIYLATYLVGEGLSGFLPSILALIQGASGAPECVPSADNSTIEAIYPPPRFEPMVFMLVLSGLAIISVISFVFIDKTEIFTSEKVSTVAKQESNDESKKLESDSWRHPRWIPVTILVVILNGLANGVMPSIQSYSCMPYGNKVYHLAVTLSTMANPMACLAGIWLLAPVKLLMTMLVFAALPFGYILTTALRSPTPPLHEKISGEALVVVSWVALTAVISYSRMWTLSLGRRGGVAVMRSLGAFGQLGSVIASLTMYAIVNYTNTFIEPPVCPTPSN
ncbi:solute carrier family 52, riboflavin transporter, member 3 [Amyelois transitella]|uniref:solute carrier family 52, riboflavin transporter, member 3 n=1 Tax=Amyelois transitella TaxID=680683 RepID=UPI002990343D|nr:solute carrier family 52, riboflavin transporter, member 3 [Amyelois transitella]